MKELSGDKQREYQALILKLKREENLSKRDAITKARKLLGLPLGRNSHK